MEYMVCISYLYGKTQAIAGRDATRSKGMQRKGLKRAPTPRRTVSLVICKLFLLLSHMTKEQVLSYGSKLDFGG